MNSDEFRKEIDRLASVAHEAGRFNHLVYEDEAIKPGDFRDTLGAGLTELEEGLSDLSRDLATLPFLPGAE